MAKHTDILSWDFLVVGTPVPYLAKTHNYHAKGSNQKCVVILERRCQVLQVPRLTTRLWGAANLIISFSYTLTNHADITFIHDALSTSTRKYPQKFDQEQTEEST